MPERILGPTAAPVLAAAPRPGAAPSSPPRDSYERSAAATRVYGALGAATGALVGRLTLLPGLGAAALGTLGGSLLGPVGAVAGAAAGVCLGLKVEMGERFLGLFPAGRVLGGALGGAVGMALGALAGRLGLLPLPEKLVEETRGFSYGKLLKNLPNPAYTSHSKLSERHYQEIMARIRPGDIVLTTQDTTLDTEVTELVLGGLGHGGWVHGAVYVGNGMLIEANGYYPGVVLRPLRQSLALSEHVLVCRPRYADDAQRQGLVEEAWRRLGRPFSFEPRLDPGNYYCTEFVYHLLKDKAPQVQVEPFNFLGIRGVAGDDLVKSPQIETVYSTGSSIYLNYLSKFT